MVDEMSCLLINEDCTACTMFYSLQSESNIFIPPLCPSHVSPQKRLSQHKKWFYVIYLDRLHISKEDFGDLQDRTTLKQCNVTHDCMALYLKNDTAMAYFIRFLLVIFLDTKRN